MKPVSTLVVVAQQGRLVLQLAPKCPIFHGSAEPSATDALTHGESTSLSVLYSPLMTTHIIVVKQANKISFHLRRNFKWLKCISKQHFVQYECFLHYLFSDLPFFKCFEKCILLLKGSLWREVILSQGVGACKRSKKKNPVWAWQ